MTTPVVLHLPEGGREVFLHVFKDDDPGARAFARNADGRTWYTRLCDPINLSDMAAIVATAGRMLNKDQPWTS
jgi:hypothetical protein